MALDTLVDDFARSLANTAPGLRAFTSGREVAEHIELLVPHHRSLPLNGECVIDLGDGEVREGGPLVVSSEPAPSVLLTTALGSLPVWYGAD
jgi:hypothetical protein